MRLVLASRYGPDCQDRVEPDLDQWYRATVEALWPAVTALTNASCAAPDLQIVHSPHSLPQLVALTDGPSLVYDQHLGQVLARLTRLTLRRAAPAEVDGYLAKLTGLRLLSRGRWRHASVLALASRVPNDGVALGGAGDAEPEALATLVQGQEAFVLAHELAHHVKFSDPLRFQVFEADVATILSQWARHRETSTLDAGFVLDELTRSAAAAWERRHGRLAPEQLAQLRQVLGSGTDGVGVAPDARDTHAAYQGDPDLREEATCDLLASMAVLPVLARGGVAPDQALQACAYAMHHLRLMQTVNSIADGTPPENLARGVHTSMTRLTVLRATLGVFAEAVFGAGFLTAAACHDLITEVNLLHALVIGDQLWTSTSRTLRSLLAMPLDGVPGREAARALLGFGDRGSPA